MRLRCGGAEPASHGEVGSPSISPSPSGYGYESTWMPGIPNGPDVLTLLAVAGPAARSLELGPAVLPTYLRHPVALASQALTVNDVLCGRLTLGIGVSHESVTSRLLGMDCVAAARPHGGLPAHPGPAAGRAAGRLRREGDADTLPPRTSATDMRGPPVFIAALGPRMLALAGALASGAATWLVGQRTLAELTVPTVREAAAHAGRPEPRVLASLPFLLTARPRRRSGAWPATSSPSTGGCRLPGDAGAER